MKYAMTTIACLIVGWLAGAILGFASFDPFDDYLRGWVFACMIYLGTPIGLALAAVTLPIIAFVSRSSMRPNQRLQLTGDARE